MVVSDQWLAATHPGYNSLMRTLIATLIALMLFTPTRVVAGDSDAAQEALSRPLEWGDAEQLDFDPAKLAIIDHEIGKLVNDDDLPGVIVAIVRRDKLVYHKTFGKLKPKGDVAMPTDAVFQIFSMTKPIVSVAVMQLVERGYLGLNDPLSNYIPAFGRMTVWENDREVPAEGKITIDDLLRHTSGLTYGFFGTGYVRSLYKAREISSRHQTLQQFVNKIASIPLEHHPGRVWEYSRSVDVLGRVIEIVSGKPLQDYLKENIFMPLGMNETYFTGPWAPMDRVARSGLADWQMRTADREVPFKSGGGGLLSTMADYITFCRMILNGGRLDGREILKRSTVNMMTSNQLGDRPRGQWDGPGRGYGFGYGFAVRIDELAAYPGSIGDLWWGGYAGTYFWIDPAKQMIVVIMVQSTKKRRALRPLMRNLVYDALEK